MTIDWLEADDSELREFFKIWLEQNRPEGAEPKKKSGGRSCSPPWDWLRQLATWRIDAAGYKNASAKEQVKNLKTSKPGNDINDVLPGYSDSGAVFKAIKSAQERIMKGLSLVQICQRWPKGEKFVNVFKEARLAPMVIDGVKPG